MNSRWLLACVLLALPAPVMGQSALQKELKDTDLAEHWIYDDLPKAREQAKAEGKPLLVVLRCVPCPPGRTLDTKLMRPDAEMEKLEKNFVCVRVVQTKGLDLKQFQYDLDQSWAAFFLNADGTIYGRYGTRTTSGPKSDGHIGETSFRKAAERALALHRGYPGNKKALEGKTGKDPEYAVPEKIPGLQDRAKTATTRQNCIHCHMVKEFAMRAKWEEGKLTGEDLWVYPMPDNIGLTLDSEDGLRVKAVAEGTPAAKAGLMVGDELTHLNGQPLISLADVQWVLHTLPAEGRLAVTLRRKGETMEKTVALEGSWKESDIGWRASSWYGLRQGVKMDPLSADDRKKRGLEEDSLALVVKYLGGRGGPKVQQAGLRVNDVIVAVNGKTKAMTESEFLVYLRLNHKPGDRLKVTVLRGDKRQELELPAW